MLSLLLLLTSFSALAYSTQIHGPLLDTSFPDPTIINVDDVYYAFSSRSTEKGKTINIPMATSERFTSGWKMLGGDALPDAGSWTASKPEVLTPDVNQLVSTPSS